MNLLPARPDQADVLARLDYSLAFSAHWSSENWQTELAQPMARIWVAWEGEKIVGFIALRGAAGQWELLNMGVAAAYQHRGIATSLLGHALETLSGQITLEVSTANVAAQALYRKVGFVKLGVRKRFYQDGTDALIMGNIE